MKLLFVHGLGGEQGGPLEQSIETEANRRNHGFLALRWPSGCLREIVGNSLWHLAKEAALEDNPWRLALDMFVAIQRQGHQSWDSALAHTMQASQRLIAIMKLLAKGEERFSVIGFSLGGRVLMSALRAAGDPGRTLHRAVFVGAAISGSSFSHLDRELLSDDRVVNIYSEMDAVLTTLYPLIHGLDGTAGAAAVHTPGVRNVRLEVGHLSYAALAHRIVDLATE